MKALIYGCLIVVAILATTALVGAAPAGQPAAANPATLAESLTSQARADYEAGKVLFADGDYASALFQFQSAYEASKDDRLLWNLAACEKSLRHYAKAIALLKRYVGSEVVEDKDRRDASQLIATFESVTVALRIDVNEPDADVELDGVPLGRSPLASRVVVDVGSHRIRATKDRFDEVVLTASLGAGREQTVTVRLESQFGRVRIEAPAYAKVLVDGEPLKNLVAPRPGGYIDRRSKITIDVVLSVGVHAILVSSPGMRSVEHSVTVRPKETHVVKAYLPSLLMEPPQESAPTEKPHACGCDVPGARRNTPASLLPVMLALALYARRSRRRDARGSTPRASRSPTTVAITLTSTLGAKQRSTPRATLEW